MKSALRSGKLKSSWPTLCAASTMHVDPALSRQRRDIGDGQHQPGAMAEMRQQHHLDRRVGVERGAVGVDQRLARRRLGQRDLDRLAPRAARASESMLVCMLS